MKKKILIILIIIIVVFVLIFSLRSCKNNENETETSSDTDVESEIGNGESENAPCNHKWTSQKETVHHEAEYEEKWVQDSAAWDEQVVTKEAWDEKMMIMGPWDEEVTVEQEVIHSVCKGCGTYFEGMTNAEIDAHKRAHAQAGEENGYYITTEVVPITSIIHHEPLYKSTVHHDAEYKTVHHEATGHNERVLVKEAYDETITVQKCSLCGETK